jgi:FkbM family methyltransferase
MNPFSAIRRVRGHTIWTAGLDSGTFVVDAGAHRGEFSGDLAGRYGCTCLLVEANPDLAAALPVPRGGKVIHAALAATDGSATFVFSDNPEAGGIAGSASAAEQPSCEVPMRSLASLLDELPTRRVDLLKLDIEGSEFSLIEKTPDSLLRGIAQITVEFHDFLPGFADPELFRTTRRKLESLGFRCFVMTIRGHGDVLFVNRRRIAIPPLSAALLDLFGRWIIKIREKWPRNR